MSSANGKAKALVILGMHRSGTSVLTRTCNLLGLDIGDGLIPALPNDNDSGFWELQEVVDLNEEFLLAYGGGHLDLFMMDNHAKMKALTFRYHQRAIALIRSKFNASSGFVMKDPRMSRLMGLWAPAIEECGFDLSYFYALRNPVEVAMSLHKRNQISIMHGLLLWFLYSREAELASRNHPRGFIMYEDFIGQWQSSIRLACEQAGFVFPRSFEAAKADVDNFINPAQRRQIASDYSLIPQPVVKFYSLCKLAVSEVVDPARFDEVYAEFDSIYSPLFQRIGELLDSAERKAVEVANAYENSTCWRATSLFRKIAGKIAS